VSEGGASAAAAAAAASTKLLPLSVDGAEVAESLPAWNEAVTHDCTVVMSV